MTKCADCGSDLVESLPVEEPQAELLWTPGKGVPFCGDTEGSDGPRTDEMESGGAQTDASGKEAPAGRGVYKDSARRAQELRDSGVTLLGVGFLGLILVLLSATGVLPFHLSGSMAYLSYGVMGGLFVVFLVAGAYSMRSSWRCQEAAGFEEHLREEIGSWQRENLTGEAIDQGLLLEGLSGEEKYFRRTERIKVLLLENFPDAEDGFLDDLIDGFYTELYGE